MNKYNNNKVKNIKKNTYDPHLDDKESLFSRATKDRRIASYYKNCVLEHGSIRAYEAHLRKLGSFKHGWEYNGDNEGIASFKREFSTQEAIVRRKQQIALKFVGAISKNVPDIVVPDRQFDVSEEISDLKYTEYVLRGKEYKRKRAEYLEYMRENALDVDTRKANLGKFEDKELRDILEQYTHKCCL